MLRRWIVVRPTLALTMALSVAACGAHITPMHPTPDESAHPVTEAPPPDATDAEYFSTHGLMVPVVGVAPDQVHDTFNESRDNGGRIHRATDIMAPRGTPIVSTSDGRILRMSKSNLGGITMYVLDTHERFLFYYAHLDAYAERLAPGQRVQQGDLLGFVGSTGNADSLAPHLHFQAMRWDPHRRDYWNCTPVDVRLFFRLIGQERET